MNHGHETLIVPEAVVVVTPIVDCVNEIRVDIIVVGVFVMDDDSVVRAAVVEELSVVCTVVVVLAVVGRLVSGLGFVLG